MKSYHPKTLFSGYKIGQKSDELYVAVPHADLKQVVQVGFQGNHMMLTPDDKPITSRIFKDKFGRGDYQMDYFKWSPDNNLFSIA